MSDLDATYVCGTSSMCVRACEGDAKIIIYWWVNPKCSSNLWVQVHSERMALLPFQAGRLQGPTYFLSVHVKGMSSLSSTGRSIMNAALICGVQIRSEHMTVLPVQEGCLQGPTQGRRRSNMNATTAGLMGIG